MDCGQAHLSSSTTPGLIITQSCLTSYEGRLRLPGRQSRQVGGEEKTVKGKEVTKEAKKASVRERKSGKCKADGARHRPRRRGGGREKKAKETLWTTAEISQFFLPPFAVFFRLTCTVIWRRWPGPPKCFPLGRLVACQPLYLSVCLPESRFSAIRPSRLSEHWVWRTQD